MLFSPHSSSPTFQFLTTPSDFLPLPLPLEAPKGSPIFLFLDVHGAYNGGGEKA